MRRLAPVSRIVAIAVAIIVLGYLLVGCSKPRCQKAVIVNVTGCHMLDLGWCHTVLELENGSRVKINGAWGDHGDSFNIVKARNGGPWQSCTE